MDASAWTFETVIDLLALFEDCPETLGWATTPALAFYVRCNDVFVWGGADVEAITPADLPDLRAAWRDCRASDEEGSAYWPELWVARKRHQRPHGAWLLNLQVRGDLALPLFLAVAPPRAVGPGNPVAFDVP